jgi:hypothetical protein
MPILNYTTTIKVEKTIGEIQGMLAKAGAQAVLMEYGPEGLISCISFRIEYNGAMVSFRLPAQLDPIYVILQRDHRVERKYKTQEQAARVAWRIIKDWIAAQLAIVEAEQCEMVEVFLPFAQNERTGETLFSTLSKTRFALLTNQKEK